MGQPLSDCHLAVLVTLRVLMIQGKHSYDAVIGPIPVDLITY